MSHLNDAFRPSVDRGSLTPTVVPPWQTTLPDLRGTRVNLRELRTPDALALHALLARTEVARFMSQPCRGVDGFERLIASARLRQAEGSCASFALTVPGSDAAIGLFE